MRQPHPPIPTSGELERGWGVKSGSPLAFLAAQQLLALLVMKA